MSTDKPVGKHRGWNRENTRLGHCCFAGCDMQTCKRCGLDVCKRQYLHDCREPYEGRHRG